MALSTFLGSIELGLIFAILSLGLFVVFRILDLPDLTVDGSFVTGLAYTAVWSKAQNPVLGIVFGVLAGGIAGIVTGILHTKLKIHDRALFYKPYDHGRKAQYIFLWRQDYIYPF